VPFAERRPDHRAGVELAAVDAQRAAEAPADFERRFDDTLSLFLIGLPAVALGTWSGLKLFGRLNEAAFRRVVLVLLLASGVALLLHLR